MLPLSKQPEIIRLHHLEKSERDRYVYQFMSTAQDWLPRSTSPLQSILADIYFSYVLICRCRRRLGEEYTYVAMYNEKHYEEQGVLINQKYRMLMFLLEIVQRHLVRRLLDLLIDHFSHRNLHVSQWMAKILENVSMVGVEGLLEHGNNFMLMLFLIGWNKHYNLTDTLLGTRYVYTYKNAKPTKVSYKIEGYLLLTVYTVKLGKFILSIIDSPARKKRACRGGKGQTKSQTDMQTGSQTELCRICYDQIREKSVTSCGHVFCWQCIVKCLSMNPQCPVCRAKNEPRQVVQLQNY